MVNECYDNRKNESFRTSSDHSNAASTMCSVFLSLHGMSPKSWQGTHKQASQEPRYCLSVFRCQRFIFPQELALTAVEREVKGVTSQTEESTRWAIRESPPCCWQDVRLATIPGVLGYLFKTVCCEWKWIARTKFTDKEKEFRILEGREDIEAQWQKIRRVDPDKLDDIYRIVVD